MGDHDTDVAEYLYKAGATRAGVIKLLCKDLSKACVGKLPRLPKVLQFHFINLIVKCIEIIHILQRFSLQHHMGLFITQHLLLLWVVMNRTEWQENPSHQKKAKKLKWRSSCALSM